MCTRSLERVSIFLVEHVCSFPTPQEPEKLSPHDGIMSYHVTQAGALLAYNYNDTSGIRTGYASLSVCIVALWMLLIEPVHTSS